MKKLKKLINLFLTYFLDLPSRMKDMINPALYLTRLRIIKVFQNKEENSKIIFIYVIFQKANIPFYVKNVLDCLEKMNVVIHIVANGNTSEDSISYLKSKSHKLILRKNIGKDFGGYKDGIMLANLEGFEKLFILNDSMFYFNKNLSNFFRELINKRADYICLNENYQHHYHAQSFLLGFSRNIFRSKFFKNFWKFYLPLNSRLHTIHKGEVGLTSLLLKNGYTPFCFNNLYELRKKLLGLTIDNLNKVLEEVFFSNRMNSDFSYLQNHLATRLLFKIFIGPEDSSKIHFINSLIELLSEHNPTHACGFLFAKLFNRPCIKRDIYYRRAFNFVSIQSALDELKYSKNEISETMDELKIKGQGSCLPFLKKLHYNLGLL
ncbi:rhamnan synthesis F family protein [Candidatus Methylopumilus universalis]|uniref:rhamnan synthesis F family protein n=1 Tax=Candidatus Methylopumilus universalis TaxID=2588536 RepID=UPI003BEEBD15